MFMLTGSWELGNEGDRITGNSELRFTIAVCNPAGKSDVADKLISMFLHDLVDRFREAGLSSLVAWSTQRSCANGLEIAVPIAINT